MGQEVLVPAIFEWYFWRNIKYSTTKCPVGIGIGIGIGLEPKPSIGIGIGIDLSEILVLVLVLRYENRYCRSLMHTGLPIIGML